MHTKAYMDLVGAQLGKYRIVEQISTGGMAEVYKAYQPDLDRYVAVKVIASALGRDPAFRRQFEREAKTLARLEHPNILPVYDSGVHNDILYLVTQYVEGGTLADYLGRPMPSEDAAQIISQVGDALGYAHAKGVIHRDVKPSNVLISQSGRVLLADFGIAQAQTEAHLSDAGAGTLAYMPPEQRAGKPVDGRADIFALGVMLYELLTGKRFGEQNLLTRSMTINRLPQSLITVITCSATYNLDARYQAAEDFVATLQEAVLNVSGKFTLAPTLSQLSLEVAALVLFGLVGLGLGVYGTTLEGSDRVVAMTQAVGCGVISLMIAFRNKTRPMSMTFLNAVIQAMLGFAALTIPMLLLESFRKFDSRVFISLLPFLAPSLVFWGIAAILYIRDERKSRTLAQRLPTLPARQARVNPFHIRQTRTAIINTLVITALLAMVTYIVSITVPRGSFLGGLAYILQGGLVFSSVILGIGLIVWYVYSQVTTTTGSFTMPASLQILSNVKARQTLLDKARDYQARIQEAIARMREGPLRDHLLTATRQIDEWIAHLKHLIAQLDEFDGDPVIRRDLSTVPRAIHSLEARLALEQDADTNLTDAVRQTLDARQTQLRHLHALERVMTQAELISEQTVTALGTIYSQILLMDAQKDIQGVQAQSLQTDIAERVRTLQDLLTAMDDVQRSRQDTTAQV